MTSVVIPLFNERDSLGPLLAELDRAFAGGVFGPVEFLFVDDGSRDGSWDAIRGLAATDPRVRAIRFRRNFGKAAALSAGFKAATGDVVFTMDGDGQDDPSEIPRFLAKLESGLDVVSGWKRRRHDPWHKVGPSRVFNGLVSALTGCRLHDHNCGFKAYRAEVLREIRLYGELHRFVPVLSHARGFAVGEIEVNHRARQHGHSKYGVARFLKGLLDLFTVRFLTRFGQRPLHIFGGVGLFLLLLGGLGMATLVVSGNRDVLVGSAALLVIGTQLVSLGLVAELVTSYNLRVEDTYSVAETLGRTPSLNPPLETPRAAT